MFTGIVVQESGRGYWWIEADATRDCVWVHQQYVVGKKFLHLNDRVQYNLAPNPRKPGSMMAVDVEIVGVTVARQVAHHAAVPSAPAAMGGDR